MSEDALPTVAKALLLLVALYPVVTAALWVAGGLVFAVFDERDVAEIPDGGWPGVTVLIPAYNEAAVIAITVHAALAVDYPHLEVLVLDDGSTDDTAAAATVAAAQELTRVYLGQLSLSEALRAGSVQLSGPRELCRGFRKWLGISPFAQRGRPALRPSAVAG